MIIGSKALNWITYLSLHGRKNGCQISQAVPEYLIHYVRYSLKGTLGVLPRLSEAVIVICTWQE